MSIHGAQHDDTEDELFGFALLERTVLHYVCGGNEG
jgi:hypothetical protein